MNQQHVGGDFFSARLETSVPQKMISTVSYTSRECPVCKRHARVLVRPPQHELPCEICVDHCEGDKKFPNSYISFKGSWLQDGYAVVQTIKGTDGKDGAPGVPGPPGRDASQPTKEELRALVREALEEGRANRFWRKLFFRLRSSQRKSHESSR